MCLLLQFMEDLGTAGKVHARGFEGHDFFRVPVSLSVKNLFAQQIIFDV